MSISVSVFTEIRMSVRRLTLDLDAALYERLKLAAARKGTTVRAYLVRAVTKELETEPTAYLTAGEAPALADLWDNPDDAAYDSL